MKKKKNFIIVGICLVLVLVIGIVVYNVLTDENKLTVLERNWVNDNISNIQNINIVNNANVFGKNGSGVFYDFLEDFSKEYSLKVNPITHNLGDNPSGVSLSIKKDYAENDLVFYEDHYVLLGKDNEVVSTINDLSGKTVGIISNDLSLVSKYNSGVNINYKTYENEESLKNAFTKEVNYIVVPLMQYLDEILKNNYFIIYHYSDVKLYYTMQYDDSYLSKVLVKFYQRWKKNFNEYFNKSEFLLFTEALKVSEAEIATLQSVEYTYGFVNNSPYEVIMGGKYGGVVGVILSKFSEFSGIEFNFVKYKNYNKFTKAIENGDVDLYFNYYNYTDSYNKTNGIPIYYDILAKRDNFEVIDSIKSLVGKTVYVQNNSLIYDYIKSINGVNIVAYENTKDLLRLNNKDVYIIVDRNIFDYYRDNELDNYTTRYTGSIGNEYNFKVKANGSMYNLLNKYMEVLDSKKLVIEGLNNHYETVKSGSVLSKVAEYIIYLAIVLLVVVLILVKKGKKVTIAKKIKKDDKLKFVDQLTSLKNRNFLNENISIWNNNTIYPQTIIVIDLNKIQEINDVYGYNEGDRQITAVANALIKTQLDNSEVMRTDGNEFVIYLVGYSQKQVTNYIHKLNKEFNKLPYNYGAEFGYSMIMDNIKTIEDALNEAVEDMRKQKSDDR